MFSSFSYSFVSAVFSNQSIKIFADESIIFSVIVFAIVKLQIEQIVTVIEVQSSKLCFHRIVITCNHSINTAIRLNELKLIYRYFAYCVIILVIDRSCAYVGNKFFCDYIFVFSDGSTDENGDVEFIVLVIYDVSTNTLHELKYNISNSYLRLICSLYSRNAATCQWIFPNGNIYVRIQQDFPE